MGNYFIKRKKEKEKKKKKKKEKKKSLVQGWLGFVRAQNTKLAGKGIFTEVPLSWEGTIIKTAVREQLLRSTTHLLIIRNVKSQTSCWRECVRPLLGK